MKHVIIGLVLALILTAPVDPSSPSASATPTSPRPNLVVIMTDDQDGASMSVTRPDNGELVMKYTNELLAQTGTTFENNFASFSLCCPSRATYLTGQYAHNHGVMSNLPPEGGYGKLDHTNTLPVWLENGGYYTTHIGKYLNGYGIEDTNPDDGIPAQQEIPPGWTEWYGSVDNSTYRFYNYTLNENGTLITYTASVENYQTDVYTDKAVDFIQRRAVATDGQPFFLSVAFLAPHDDNASGSTIPGPQPAPRHAGLLPGIPLPQPPSLNEPDITDKPPYFTANFSQTLPLTNTTPAIDSLAEVNTSYRRRLESLLAVDEAVRDIVTALTDTSQLTNTVVIFTADNGYLHGEHRIPFGKIFVYEESIRIPLIISAPGYPAHQTSAALAANVDLAPTIVAFSGVAPGLVMDGRSLAPFLGGGGSPFGWRTALLLETNGLTRVAMPPYQAIRTDRYVYVEYDNGEREFYDLQSDPWQIDSHADNPSPDEQVIIADLSGKLDDLRNCAGASCWLYTMFLPLIFK